MVYLLQKSFSQKENTLPVYHFAVLVFPPYLPLFFFLPLKVVGFALKLTSNTGGVKLFLQLSAKMK